jgi:DNA-directed RNA polymerase sigma subunit (sigma70/sigma32)
MELSITTERVRKLEDQALTRLAGRPELEALRLAA